MSAYAFGDTDLAARRLKLLADTFSASSSAFLRESAKTPPKLAADLGCGPGYSTHLVADTLAPRHTAGLDNSESFLSQARLTASGRVSFHLHDITNAPFPLGPYDLVFSRFELTHLREPEEIVRLWGTQLRLHGLLLIEEVEYIHTSDPTLLSYLNIQHEMLVHQGNALYIGPRLDAIIDSTSLKRRASKVQVADVPASRAATMFHMNLCFWRHNDFVQRRYEPTHIDELEEELSGIIASRIDTGSVEWGLRQMVMERVAH